MLFFADVQVSVQKRNIPYYDSLLRDAIANQKAYYDKIKTKISNIKRNLGDRMEFYGIDAMRVLEQCGEGDFVLFDPPYFEGGYEKMFEVMEKMYNFRPEPYTEFNDEIKREEMERLHRAGCAVMYRCHNELPPKHVPEGFDLVYKHGYKYNAFYCLYYNREQLHKHVGRFNPLKEIAKTYPMITPKCEITNKSRIEVIPVPNQVANHYRLMWVKKAKMSDGGDAYLVLVDKKIIGLFLAASGQNFGLDVVWIVSDPAAPYSKYLRLSKLVVAVYCTQTVIKLLNEKFCWFHRGFITRVFTNEHVSMKYRDMFELTKREKNPNEGQNLILSYRNYDTIFPNYKAALTWWLQKHSKYTI